MMRTLFVLAGVAALATLPSPAFADITVKSQDGGMELPVPNGWHEVKPEGPMTKLVAADGRGSRVSVRIMPKEDFKDGKAVANFAVVRLKLTDGEDPKFEEVQIGGKPATRANVMGTLPSGKRAGFVITVYESGNMYVAVVGSSDASNFTKEAPVLTGFASQLKVTPTAATPAKPTPKQ